MAVEIRVPQLGESVVEATVARWLKRPGETVETGEPVVELETEKVNIEVPAEGSGVLASIAHQEGETVRIGDVLGTLANTGAAPAPPANGANEAAPPAERAGEASPPVAPSGATYGRGPGAPVPPPPPPEPPLPAPAATAQARSTASPAAPAAPPLPAGEGRGEGSATTAEQPGAARVYDGVSPVAQRIAAERGIDATRLDGSGPGGRVMKSDVLGLAQPAPVSVPAPATSATPAAPAPPRPAPPTPAAAPAILSAGDPRGEERVRLSRRRLTIARRLVEAQHTAAMLTTFNEIDMSAIMDVRKRRRDAFKERHGVSLGFMSFFTKASIGALKAFPAVNAELQGEELILKRYYDVGIAVSTEEGLVVPVVRDADRKTFAEIEREIASLATRARERKLTLAELRGGTFTITNGGVFGSLLSTPILNPPQVAILGMHKIEERPVAQNGQVVIKPMMYVALSYDHRVVDGREAVSFLVKIKELLEDPESLLLEG